MVRSVGLWRAVVHRSRADWPVVTAAFALLVCAIGLLADRRAVRRHGCARRPPPGGPRRPTGRPRHRRSDVGCRPADIAALDATVRDQLADALSAVGGEVALVAPPGSLAPAGLDTDAAREHLTAGQLRGLDRHADLDRRTLGRGRARAGRGDPVGGSRRGARARRLATGQAGARSQPSEAVERHRSWGCGDPRRRRLLPRRPARARRRPAGRERVTTRGPFVVRPSDLGRGRPARDSSTSSGAACRRSTACSGRPGRGRSSDAVDGAPAGAPGGAAAAAHADGRDERSRPSWPTRQRSILVSRSGVTLLTIQFAVLAGYAVLLVAGLLVERRRSETALLRSRGATAVHLVALAFGEAVSCASRRRSSRRSSRRRRPPARDVRPARPAAASRRASALDRPAHRRGRARGRSAASRS